MSSSTRSGKNKKVRESLEAKNDVEDSHGQLNQDLNGMISSFKSYY